MNRIEKLRLAATSLLTVGASTVEHRVDEHQIVVIGIAVLLTHVFAHLTADQAHEALAGLGDGANHDLEFALACAYREALKHAQTEVAGGLPGADLKKNWFDVWEKRLAEVRNPADAARFFNPSDLVDPVGTALEPDPWPDIRLVLLRWAGKRNEKQSLVRLRWALKPDENPSLPPDLEAYLAEHLPALIETAMERVIREERHRRGWIAWQETYLKAIHRVGVETNQRTIRIEHTGVETNEIARRILANQLENQQAHRHSPPSKADIDAYLEKLWEDTRHIEIKNLRTSDGSANVFAIDLLYTPLTTVLPHSAHPHGQEPGPERLERTDVPLHEALRQPRLLLVGDPGAGKTTFLRRIAFEACHVRLCKEAERPIERLLSDPRFPVMVSAENLAANLPEHGDSFKLLFDFLDKQYPSIGADHFREEFDKGCQLFLDGLDEIAAEALRDRTVKVLKGVANEYPKTRIVATSRPGLFGGVTSIAKFDSVRVAPLDRAAKAVFIEKWGRAVHPTNEAAAAELSGTLLSEVNAKKEIRALAGNPVMLTALACLHFTHATLPEQRSELYNSVLEWLALARVAKTGRDHSVLLALLRELAFAMHAAESNKRAEIERDEAVQLLAPEFQNEKSPGRQREAAERFLLAEEVNSGIIVSHGEKIRFWHLTFQEALSANYLVFDEEARQRLIFDEDRVHDPQWRETVLLLAGELMKRGNKPVNKFLDKVLWSAEGKGLLREVRCAGLMGALLKDLAAWKYALPDALEVRYRAILGRVRDIFDREKSKAFSLEERLEAAEALGQFGDPRLKLPNDKDYWVPIPEGPFIIGDDENKNAPHHEVHLDAFLIGRYPVTVQEYGHFLDDTEYKEPPDWDEQSEHRNRPVVSVSWYDADAYCKWANDHYKCRGLSLPTEAQWERAARGVQGRKYAWGNDPPTPELANYDEAKINHSSPVGLFPQGSTPDDDIADLTGNVWEWVSDWYRHVYYKESEKTNPKGPESGEYKVLRGGSWGFASRYLRAAYRLGGQPDIGVDDVGFRCIREVFP